LLLGAARRAGHLVGAVYTLLIWAVGEGFGGPYMPGSTDVGTGIVYALLFITLLAFAPPARRERLSLDRVLVPRWPWWRFAAESHAVDRVRGVPLVEPVIVGETPAGHSRAGKPVCSRSSIWPAQGAIAAATRQPSRIVKRRLRAGMATLTEPATNQPLYCPMTWRDSRINGQAHPRL
jgi:hypothetical protein